MKFIILGAGSGLPHPDMNQAAIVVQTGAANYLLDCGEGTARQLVKHDLSGNFIDAVLISHYHPDHISGFFMLMQLLYLEKRTKPLYVFLPERPSAILDIMHLFYTFEQRFAFPLKLHEMSEVELYFPDVAAVLTDHMLNYGEYVSAQHLPNQLQSFCFSITEEGKNLLYTSDLYTFMNIEHIIEKANVVIVDALHPEAEVVLQLDNYPAERIYLTHGISEKLRRHFAEAPNPRYVIAREDVIYTL